MLRTNSKKAKANVADYIRNNSEYIKEYAEFDGIEIKTDADICNYIWKDFLRVKEHEVKKSRNYSYQSAFSDYASGLPLGMFDYHYNVCAVDLVGDILEETEAERNRYTEEQATRLMDYLIYKMVCKF